MSCIIYGLRLDDLIIKDNIMPIKLSKILKVMFGNDDFWNIIHKKTSKGYYSNLYLDYIDKSDNEMIPIIGWYTRVDSNIYPEVIFLGGEELFSSKKELLMNLSDEFELNSYPQFHYPTKDLIKYEKIYLYLKGTFGEFASYLPILSGIKRRFPHIELNIYVNTPDSIINIVKQQFENEKWIDNVVYYGTSNYRSSLLDISERTNLTFINKLNSKSLFYQIVNPGAMDPNFPINTQWKPDLSVNNIIFADKFLENSNKNYIVCINIREKPFLTGYFWTIRNWYDLIQCINNKINVQFVLIGESQFGSQSYKMANYSYDCHESDYYLKKLLNMNNVLSLIDNYHRDISYTDVLAVINKSDLLIGYLSGFIIQNLVSYTGPPVCSLLPKTMGSTDKFRRRFYITDYYLTKKKSRYIYLEEEQENIANQIVDMLKPTWSNCCTPLYDYNL
ncbi:hypothetical protein [Bacillus cereus]|uniref:Uncharacterized protein n=1 Tax=Bacillus cereus HuA2-1 TaxID=1053201 RepID=J9BKP8_BACCE|nr:hypothetical protein [Bacillus cereus]EJV74132.1 hypothetical protein IG3_05954 [Bacillus cereus HuA2-1]